MTRAARLAGLLAERELDSLLVTNRVNVRYLTHFTGSNGLALVGREQRVFVTDFRYVEQVSRQVSEEFERVTGERDLLGDIGGLLPQGRVRLGIEADNVTLATHERLRELLEERIELVPVRGLVEGLRQIKDESELAAIRCAARVADEAFGAVLDAGLVGRTEREVAWALECEMHDRGAEGPAFASIVAAAGHGARPHAEPRDVPIPRDTLVIIDWGARVDGYCSDCTRTLATGALDPDAEAAYRLVERAQLVALEGVAAGPTGYAVDALARDIIVGAGEGERFGHGLGHGVGLEVHEAPTLSHRAEPEPLRAGQVVTVEPGVYVPGRFGVRIEDLVIVRESGHEVLSGHPKGLTVVD